MKSYIRVSYAKAACSLLEELERLGIVATVGYHCPNRDRTLRVDIRTGDAAMVPSEWNGFTVLVEREARR